MKWTQSLLLASLIGCGTIQGVQAAHPVDADIYAVRFSEDGRYLVTGGYSGDSAARDRNFTGGIKIWDAANGSLLDAFGQQADINSIFGAEYGRVGKRHWNIHSFRDVILTGSWPRGKVVLLPSSLSEIRGAGDMHLPDFIGGYLDLSAPIPKRIPIPLGKRDHRTCGKSKAAYEYIGPMVSSHNGRYAAVVVNTCKVKSDRNLPLPQYDSDLFVMDLRNLKVVHRVRRLDSGIYALGITEDGRRVAYVGRDRFAVLDTANDRQRVIERYPDAVFQLPRQFSQLYFNTRGDQLVSLHYILDIRTGKEKALEWGKDSVINHGRTSQVKVSPDLSFFVLVKPKRSFIVFDDDGFPRSYGKADEVYIVNTHSGREHKLAVTSSTTEGKRCVTDISPDSRRVAVACRGGLLKLFDAASGKLIWERRNIGYRDGLDENLKRVEAPAAIRPWHWLSLATP